MVRTGATRADLCARFALKDTPAALRWLEETSLKKVANAYFAALSAAMVAHGALLTAPLCPCLNCVSSVSC